MNEIINIVFSYDDVDELAEQLGVETTVARQRAGEWAKSITSTAVTLINEQLSNAIEFDAP